MMKPANLHKTAAAAVILAMLLITALIWLRPTATVEPPDNAETGNRSLEHRAKAHSHESLAMTDALARKLSPRTWTPPAVFAETGKPAPRIEPTRGKNSRREFGTPTIAALPAKSAEAPAAILAKTPDDGRLYLLTGEIDEHTLIARRMVLDTAALDSVVSGNTSTILAPTTGDEVLTLEIDSVVTRSADTHTLKGRILGEVQTSDVQLVYHNGVIHGTVARYNTDQHLEYRILANGYMMVRELDTSTMTAECGNNAQTKGEEIHEPGTSDGSGTALEQAPQGEPAADTAGYTTVDVVVGYDKAARIADGGYSQIEARIIGSMDSMNTAFGNSLIANTEMMLLGTIEDPYYSYPGTTANSMSDELSELWKSADGKLDTVSNYGNQLGADYYSFITKDADGSAGQAYASSSYSVVARTYMTSSRITFAHELGHNLGCDHSWGDSDQSTDTNYGWRIKPAGQVGVRTIMAYDWDWGNGSRIPYFSNPSVIYQGEATGATNGFDVANQPNADQRYRIGGYDALGPNDYNLNPTAPGFDGTRSALGANNAACIADTTGYGGRGATRASIGRTRTTPSVLTPAVGSIMQVGSTQDIYFIGGDYTDLAKIELLKGGVVVSVIAPSVNPATGRHFAWTLLTSLAPGADYSIRVTLTHGGTTTAVVTSGVFTITQPPTYTVSYNANGTTSGSAPANQTKTDGVALTLATNSGNLSKTGYTFAGWCTTPDGTGTRYAAGATYTAEASTALYARWNSPPQVSAGSGQTVVITASGTPWSPKATTAVAWYDAADSTTVTSSSGSVSQWRDKLGTRHFAQATAANKPAYVGNSYLQFDGTDDFMTASGIGSQNVTVFGVVQTTADNTNTDGNKSWLTEWNGTTANPDWTMNALTSTDKLASLNLCTNLTGQSFQATANRDARHIHAMTSFNSSSDGLVRVDGGSSQGAIATLGYPLQSGTGRTLTLGRQKSTFTARYHKGRVHEIVILDQRLLPADADYLKIEGYLAHKWAMAANLPSAHPYKAAAPTSASASASLAASVSDNENDTLTMTWSRVSGPASVSFSSPTTASTNALFTATGVYTLRLSVSDGIAVTTSDVVVNVQDPSPYNVWAGRTFANPFTDTAITSNPDGDGLSNLMEYAFGTDPTSSANPGLSYAAGGEVIVAGSPLFKNFASAGNPADYRAVFIRRKNSAASGLAYAAWFTADLGLWTQSASGLIVLTNPSSTGELEVVSVPFPGTVPLQTGGTPAPPKFFRVGVTAN